MMKRSFFLLALSALTLPLVGCAADAASDEDSEGEAVEATEEGLSGNPSNFGYFIVTRRDMRRCMAPLCGGYFVKRVNQATTKCADGKMAEDCYVPGIELKNIGLSAREEADFRGAVESGKALVKGAIYKKTWNGVVLGTLKANEGWLGASGATPDGTFYRAAPSGITCVKAPCPSTRVFGLNGADSHNVIDVRFDTTSPKASDDAIARAESASWTKDGVLLAGGVAIPKCLPNSNCGPFATSTEFYLRVKKTEGVYCGGRGMGVCNDGQFCQWKAGDICGAADAPGRCAYRPDVCAKVYKPVCGCNGKTYGNECEAAAVGMSVATNGACP
jgi:hypothetical protein